MKLEILVEIDDLNLDDEDEIMELVEDHLDDLAGLTVLGIKVSHAI